MLSQSGSQITTLRNTIAEEIYKAIGLSPQARLRNLLSPLLWAPTQRFAELAASFDRQAAQAGVCEAARWVLPRFVRDLEARQVENIPSEGPLIIAANHPGTVDGLAIAASLQRPDLKIIASGLPFLRALSGASRYFIFVPRPPEMHGRMNTLREAIRQLKEGGALLIFPSGSVDPDPDVLPGAQEALCRWSPSLEVLLRHVPQASLLVTIVSGVLSPNALRNPLLRLRKGFRERQLLAEFIQVVQLLWERKRFVLTPKVTFAPPVTLDELRAEVDTAGLLPTIITRAQGLLATHLATDGLTQESQPGCA